jgi:hypothetical protein
MTQPKAWLYELAHSGNDRDYYDNFVQHISTSEPHVPEGSIRNLTPLFAIEWPKPPWRLVHLGDTSVSGHPRWEATLHRPIDDPEYMFESKWGQGGTPEEALKAARDAKGDKVMRYITSQGGAGKVTPGLTFEGEIDDDEVMF